MQGLTALWKKPVLKGVGILIAALFVLSGCGGSTTPTTTGAGTTTPAACTSQGQAPIKIGISLSLSGDFSADGKAFQQGYQLWANAINASGGLLGRQVTLDIVNDASSPVQVATNYQKLISV